VRTNSRGRRARGSSANRDEPHARPRAARDASCERRAAPQHLSPTAIEELLSSGGLMSDIARGTQPLAASTTAHDALSLQLKAGLQVRPWSHSSFAAPLEPFLSSPPPAPPAPVPRAPPPASLVASAVASSGRWSRPTARPPQSVDLAFQQLPQQVCRWSPWIPRYRSPRASRPVRRPALLPRACARSQATRDACPLYMVT